MLSYAVILVIFIFNYENQSNHHTQSQSAIHKAGKNDSFTNTAKISCKLTKLDAVTWQVDAVVTNDGSKPVFIMQNPRNYSRAGSRKVGKNGSAH